jgi:methionine synthase I (cobalamin-dependent)
MGFLDALHGKTLVFDGPMGTTLLSRGYAPPLEPLVLTAPDAVLEVHRAHLAAGARVLRTHSFGANAGRFPEATAAARIPEWNRRAAALARRAAESATGAFVAGSIGPLGADVREHGRARELFRVPVRALAESGVDALIFETMTTLGPLRAALEASEDLGLPRLALMSFSPAGLGAAGESPEGAARALADWGADAVGVNCGDGPASLLRVAARMCAAVAVPVVAIPSAGLPGDGGARPGRGTGGASPRYPVRPEDFAAFAAGARAAGVAAVGGCCGAEPEHIRALVTPWRTGRSSV